MDDDFRLWSVKAVMFHPSECLAESRPALVMSSSFEPFLGRPMRLYALSLSAAVQLLHAASLPRTRPPAELGHADSETHHATIGPLMAFFFSLLPF